ncbi:Ankyrin Repeat Domain-Containing Protein 26-Like Protein-Like [Manis pentadactyla]|nr:Ankyrin Repeat Domain-Containing Protein 26-Like Protein-Like [Manis pentadactyla]
MTLDTKEARNLGREKKGRRSQDARSQDGTPRNPWESAGERASNGKSCVGFGSSEKEVPNQEWGSRAGWFGTDQK